MRRIKIASTVVGRRTMVVKAREVRPDRAWDCLFADCAEGRERCPYCRHSCCSLDENNRCIKAPKIPDPMRGPAETPDMPEWMSVRGVPPDNAKVEFWNCEKWDESATAYDFTEDHARLSCWYRQGDTLLCEGMPKLKPPDEELAKLKRAEWLD